MRTIRLKHMAKWLATVIVTAAISTCSAQQPHDGWWLCPGISLYRPCMCCTNDYCPKPMPCTAPYRCFGCDDYCSKQMPCTAPYCCFGCDDYCCKLMPFTSPCYIPPGSTCGPCENCTHVGQVDCHRNPGGFVEISDR